MSDIVLRVDNLGKQYRIGQRAPERNLRETLTDAFAAPFRRRREASTDVAGSSDGTIWALKDVSFEVKQGEVVGVIGRNGSGKSTLLKILSRITEPTTGRAEIRGRISSLLEVGTGFHPELTGRENIYLNGAILGMTRAEIARKFDEIVAFSEIEQFLDTPVKRYSSGMYVRLAFAVAAHLEPEILLVDEVLAVGDAAFQKKCLGKMGDVAKEGRTVLFVSHAMNSVHQLCPTSFWLDRGTLKQSGKTRDVIQEYLHVISYDQPARTWEEDPAKRGQFLSLRVINDRGNTCGEFSCDDPVTIEFSYRIRERMPGLYFALYVQNAEGLIILFTDSRDDMQSAESDYDTGSYRFHVTIPARILGAGRYTISIGSAIDRKELIEEMAQACVFRLFDYTSKRGDTRPGVLSVLVPWQHECVSA